MCKFFKLLVCIASVLFAVTPGFAEETANWVVVDLDTPGNLGVEILYQVDKLSDVTHLRVSGQINSTDWATINNLTSIVEIDLEKTITASIPDATFEGRRLESVKLPESLEKIGEYAFSNTSIKEIRFPVSMKSMGNAAFSGCNSLSTVMFPSNAKITIIPDNAFSSCYNLTSINIPGSVTDIDNYAFYNDHILIHIDLPENLNTIGEGAFESTGLVSVKIPQYVNRIGVRAFINCTQLEEIELPTSIHFLDWLSFYDCISLKKVVIKSPNPPSHDGDVFAGADIENTTLIVPDFAVPGYKLDAYWLRFGKIEGGAKSDFWDIAGAVSLTDDRRLEGTPSITIRKDGNLKVSGSSAMPIDKFKMDYDQSVAWYSDGFGYSQFINNSPLVSANNVEIVYSVRNEYWHFIALPFDVKVDDISHSDSSAEYVVRYYDGAERAATNETGNSWKDVTAGTVIKAGTGIIVQSNTDGEITFPCADDGRNTIFNPNTIEMELAANKAESSANSGWNLVANPYPCFYDMYYSMLSCPITVYNPDDGNYVAYSLVDDNVVLWPGRPFFIQASEDVKKIVFSNIGRQFSPEVNRSVEVQAKSHSAINRALFNISLSYNGFTDTARVIFNPEASEDYEVNRDASKFLSNNTDIPQVYTFSAVEEYLAINERNEADGIVSLGFYAPAAGEMSLSMSRIDGKASLYDAETDKTINLNEGEIYPFSVSTPGFDNTRFSLKLKTNNHTGMNDIYNEEAVSVVADNGVIRVFGAGEKEVIISSIDGVIFVNETAGTDIMEYALPCGIYIVKAGTYTSKCLIK